MHPTGVEVWLQSTLLCLSINRTMNERGMRMRGTAEHADHARTLSPGHLLVDHVTKWTNHAPSSVSDHLGKNSWPQIGVTLMSQCRAEHCRTLYRTLPSEQASERTNAQRRCIAWCSNCVVGMSVCLSREWRSMYVTVTRLEKLNSVFCMRVTAWSHNKAVSFSHYYYHYVIIMLHHKTAWSSNFIIIILLLLLRWPSLLCARN